jgi:Tol biopolymer transport system component
VFLKLGAPPILFPSDWSADGRFLAYYRSDPKTQLDIWTLGADRADERKPIPFLRGDFNESQPQFSPDGRWVAYVSDESGSQQVYVRSFLAVGGQRQISTDGGTQPRWRRDGKELFYLARDRKLMAVMVKTGATLEADLPRVLFQTELNVNALRQSYAVSANGQRFLLNTPSEVRPSSIIVVVNWTAALKK